MEDLLQELEAIDSREGHLETLDNLLIAYLMSEAANDYRDRVNILMLCLKLRQLFL